MRARLIALLVVALLAVPAASRATITIVNTDGAGEGFNDPTPAAPVGGNPGTTIGQQRLNDFEKAAQIWDAILRSPVPIRIRASFDPLFCTATSAVLGSAGPNTIDFNFSGAPFADTWFVGAEADRLAGTDLDPGTDDIGAQFSSTIGNPGCLTGRFWYYGFDGNEGTNVDLLPVLLHEFGHGLGFLTTTDESDGSYFFGMPSVFDHFLMDDVTHKHWIDMSPGERVASAINTTHLVWDGPAVTAAVPTVLGKRAHVAVSGALFGDFNAGQGVIGPALTAAGINGDVDLVNDGIGTTSDGCETPYNNDGSIAGKVALIDRTSSCNMVVQSTNAQANGAIALIIINNVPGPAPQVRGNAPAVTIPVVAVSQTDGNAIRAALSSGAVHVNIGLDPAHLAGANDSHQAMMFAPNPDQPGSSVSHWDVSAFPNLLMEPSANPDLSTNTDMTNSLFFDIGWFPDRTDVEPGQARPLSFVHTPNPAREGGTLRFMLPAAGRVDLAIFDVAGRRLARLVDGRMEEGDHSIKWTRHDDAGRRVGAGIYLARIRCNGVEQSLHIVLTD